MKCQICEFNKVKTIKRDIALFRHLDFTQLTNCKLFLNICTNCGLVFRNISSNDSKELYNHYNSDKYRHTIQTAQTYDGKTRQLIQSAYLLRDYNNKQISILDIGCLDGHLLNEFNNICPRSNLHGYDVGKFPLSSIPNYITYHNKSLDNVSGKFDIITLSHCIQYIENMPDLFYQLKRLLAVNGKIYIQTPDFSKKPASLLLGDAYYHFSSSSLSNISQICGFTSKNIRINAFSRDVTCMLQIGAGIVCDTNINEINKAIESIDKICNRINNLPSNRSYSILGTTIEAALCHSMLDNKTVRFVDENKQKVGKDFHDRAVIHPEDLKESDNLIIPYGKSARSIFIKYKNTFRGNFICL